MAQKILSLRELAYRPLAEDRHEVRLLQLKHKIHEPTPLIGDRILCCELIHVERGLCQPYIALSYSWGRNIDHAPLRIGDQHYHVNATVDAALRQLQSEDTDVLVWIDQICINQQDDVEKGHQVKQMKEIYSDAETVVAWLGSTENGSDRLLRHIGRIGNFIWAGEHQRVFASHQGEEALEAIGRAFRFLCEREYWKRLWIMQEFAVASRLRIACGDVMIWDWQLQAVLVFVNRLPAKGQDILARENAVELLSRGMTRAYISSATSFTEGVFTRRARYCSRKDNDDPLIRVLVTTLVLEHDCNQPLTTDPRDRIFSVLQLASDRDDFGCFPDYTWSCEKVFREATLIMLRQGHVDLLAYCQFPRDSLGVPTWVPDLRMRILSPCTGHPWTNHFHASGKALSQQEILSPTAETIVLQGVLVDTVEACGDTWDPDWLEPIDHAAARVYLEQIRGFCENSPRLRASGETEIGAACLYIASCADIPDDPLMELTDKAYDAILGRLDNLAVRTQTVEEGGNADVHEGQDALDHDLESENGVHWYIERLRLLHSRRPFTSKTGFVGSVPQSAQPGDIVCIFLGGKIPYVIRRVEDDPEIYVLVGEAYVHGIMKGEFVRSDSEIVHIMLR
ncbi:heterokaryon incompatibility protein-domain-containing protein [Hypoxylon crocopeplum]|nr:heterokaryon incompatibility protein-domain-containing protein [Hypoxylon crocopeplum]